eukprot:Skav236411  [mRNA]  locus=scaffold4178:11367:23314:+ [translate_table: standard]
MTDVKEGNMKLKVNHATILLGLAGQPSVRAAAAMMLMNGASALAQDQDERAFPIRTVDAMLPDYTSIYVAIFMTVVIAVNMDRVLKTLAYLVAKYVFRYKEIVKIEEAYDEPDPMDVDMENDALAYYKKRFIELQDEVDSWKECSDNYSQQIRILQEEKAECWRDVKRLEKDYERLEHDKTSAERSLDYYKSQTHMVDEDLRDAKNQIQTKMDHVATAARRITYLEEMMEREQKKVAQMKEDYSWQLKDKDADIHNLKVDIENLTYQLNEAKKEPTARPSQKRPADDSVRSTSTSLWPSTAPTWPFVSLDAKDEKIRELEKTVLSREEEIRDYVQQVNDFRDQLQAKDNELAVQEEMLANKETEICGQKRVIDESGHWRGRVNVTRFPDEVYVTRMGHCYHKSGWDLIKNSNGVTKMARCCTKTRIPELLLIVLYRKPGAQPQKRTNRAVCSAALADYEHCSEWVNMWTELWGALRAAGLRDECVRATVDYCQNLFEEEPSPENLIGVWICPHDTLGLVRVLCSLNDSRKLAVLPLMKVLEALVRKAEESALPGGSTCDPAAAARELATHLEKIRTRSGHLMALQSLPSLQQRLEDLADTGSS